MKRQAPLVTCVAVLTCVLQACQGRGPITTEGEPDGAWSATSGPVSTLQQANWADSSLAAIFRVEIDPITLESAVSPEWSRSGQTQRQGDLFDIDAIPFMEARDVNAGLGFFRVSRLERDVNQDLLLTFRHSHPWPAPADFSTPATAVKRADLGYTGRLVILADIVAEDEDHSFFGDTIVANTEAILDPDGYIHPVAHTDSAISTIGNSPWNEGFLDGGGLVTLNTNTWPYKLLCDEALNLRTNTETGSAISNSGNVRGNYTVGSGGWQQSNAGSGNAGWTGFDFVHQGQTVRNSFTISEQWLSTADTSLKVFRVAVLLKYTDPRGGTNVNNRLPVSPASEGWFAYRLPHAALDCSDIALLPAHVDMDLTVEQATSGTGAEGTVVFAVRDWDSHAPETSGGDPNDLTGQPLGDVQVKAGMDSGGYPTFDLSIPKLSILQSGGTMTATTIGSPAAPTGPDNLLIPTAGHLFINGDDTVAPSVYPGLIRVTDPETVILADSSAAHFGIDGANPGGGASVDFAMRIETFQAFHVTVVQVCDDTPPGSITWDSELSASANTSSRGQLVDIVQVPSTVSSPHGDLYLVAYKDTNTSGSPNPLGIHVAVFELDGGGMLQFVEDQLVGNDNVSWLQIAAAGNDGRGVLLTAREIGSGDLIGYTYNYTSSPGWHALSAPIDGGDILGEHDLIRKDDERMFIAYQTIAGLKVVSLDPNYTTPGSPSTTSESVPTDMAGPGGGESPNIIFMDSSGNDGNFLVCARDPQLNQLRFGRQNATFSSIVVSDPSGPPTGCEPSMSRNTQNVPMIAYRTGSNVAGSILFINGTASPDSTTSEPTWDTTNGPYVIVASDASTSFLHPRFCLIDSRPGLVCAMKDTPASVSGDHDVLLLRSCAEEPSSAEFWTSFVVSNTVTPNVGGYLAAVADGNQFVFAAYDDTNEDPVILRSTGSN